MIKDEGGQYAKKGKELKNLREEGFAFAACRVARCKSECMWEYG